MERRPTRSASMLISVYIDPESATGWYAHIYSYADAFERDKDMKYAITVSEVSGVMRTWLTSVIKAP
jgi:hypothetical protein